MKIMLKINPSVSGSLKFFQILYPREINAIGEMAQSNFVSSSFPKFILFPLLTSSYINPDFVKRNIETCVMIATNNEKTAMGAINNNLLLFVKIISSIPVQDRILYIIANEYVVVRNANLHVIGSSVLTSFRT